MFGPMAVALGLMVGFVVCGATSQEAAATSVASDRPYWVTYVIDVRPSMKPLFAEAREEVATAVRGLVPAQRAAVIKFGTGAATQVSPLRRMAPENKRKTTDELRSLELEAEGGKADVYMAEAVAHALKQKEGSGRVFIYLLTSTMTAAEHEALMKIKPENSQKLSVLFVGEEPDAETIARLKAVVEAHGGRYKLLNAAVLRRAGTTSAPASRPADH